MNGMQKYVVSTTLDHPKWNNTTIIKGNIAEEVSRVKALPGEDILVAGSGMLAHSLMEHDLVDVYRLMVFQVVLGKGKRLFNSESKQSNLHLMEANPVGDEGVLTLVYHCVIRK